MFCSCIRLLLMEWRQLPYFLWGEIHAEDHHKVDWKKCIICQENTFPIKTFPLSKGTSVGISKVVDYGEVIKECNDASYKQCSRVVTCLRERGSRDVFWHRQCYSDFTNKEHIQRLKNRALIAKLDEAIPEPPTSATRRSSLDPVDWKKCIFCQTDLKTVALNQVQTFETSDKILKNAKFDKEVSCRLAGISDLIAAEWKYHFKCYARFLRNTQKIPQDDQATLDGCLRLASSKSDLGNSLQKNFNQSQPPISHHKTCTIIDGMAVVQSLGNTTGAKSFGEWSDNFTAFVVSHAQE